MVKKKEGGEVKVAKKGSTIGSWAFLIGIILAVLLGALGELKPIVITILVVLGIIIGLLNISDEEVQPFLMAGAVLVIVASLGNEVMTSVPILGRILNAVLALFVPATMIVALKSVFSLAKG